MITDRQVLLMRQKLMEGKSQETAAAMAGMSVRSARNWQQGPLPSEKKKKSAYGAPGQIPLRESGGGDRAAAP